MTPTQRKHLRTGARNITKAVLLATLVNGSDKGSWYSLSSKCQKQ